MRQIWRFTGFCLCAMSVLAMVSCSSSTTPKGDTVPPEVTVYLSVGHLDSACPMMVRFSISPLSSRDNETDRDNLKIRWDFDNDGTWDTSFLTLDSINPYEPNPLPVETWTVTCEVVDEANNSSVHTESMELPRWLPVAPDIIAGGIEVSLTIPFSPPVDTLRVGEVFRVMFSHSEWVESSGMPFTAHFFIDDELAQQVNGSSLGPFPDLCWSTGYNGFVGFETPGLHEIKVVVNGPASVMETDLENNTTIRQIVVVE